jgi:hypothetical protein
MNTTAGLLAATAQSYHGTGIGLYVLGAALVLALAFFLLGRQLRAGRGRADRRPGTGPEPPWPADDDETTRDQGGQLKP